MKRTLLIALISTIFSLVTFAQKTQHRHLSLDESIKIAKEKSLRMLKLEQSLKRAEFDLQSVERSLKTNIDLTLGLPQYSDHVVERRDSSGVTYYSERQLSYEGDLTIRQPLPTDGSIYIQNTLSSVDDMKRDLRSTYARTRIGIEQPLDAFYGYNHIRSTLKRAKLAHERSSKSLKREELNLVYDVSNSYYNLLSLQERTNIALLDLDRQTEAYDISQNKFSGGLIREVDALQMEVDLAEAQNNYEIALLNQSSATNSFKELLGVNLRDSISLKTDLKYEKIIVDPELAIQYALHNRLEIREQEIQIELQQINIKQQKANRIIKASVNAHFEQIGVDQTYDKKFLSSIGGAYANFGDRPSNYGVGVTFNIPILDWGENRSRVRAAESQLQEIKYTKDEVERSIEREVMNLVAGINNNLKRLQLLEKNVAVAEKSFDITRQRYTDGDINSQDLALERNRLNNAYISHLSAFINYRLSLADLMRKTFYDFEQQQPVL